MLLHKLGQNNGIGTGNVQSQIIKYNQFLSNAT